MADPSPVDRLYQEAIDIIGALGSGEPSLTIAAGDSFHKALVLAAASHFEHRVCRCVTEFVGEISQGNRLVVSLVANKAVSRQYHTWFKWTDPNANQFFSLFGAEFKQLMVDRVKQSEELKESIRAFLEIGNERNKLAHQDFASFSLEKTLDEIYAMYTRALLFVSSLPDFLRQVKE